MSPQCIEIYKRRNSLTIYAATDLSSKNAWKITITYNMLTSCSTYGFDLYLQVRRLLAISYTFHSSLTLLLFLFGSLLANTGYKTMTGFISCYKPTECFAQNANVNPVIVACNWNNLLLNIRMCQLSYIFPSLAFQM